MTLPPPHAVPSPSRARRGAAKPILLVLLLAAAALIGWLSLELLGDDGGAGAAVDAAGAGRTAGSVRPGGPETALVRPEDPDAAALAVPSDATSPAGGRSAGRKEAREAGAVYVSGRVLFPDGLPLDERMIVESRERSGLGKPRDRDEVDGNGSFSVAFSPDTSVGWLRLQGRYSWFPGTLSLRPGKTPESEIELQPILGGRVEGTLVVDGGGPLPAGEIEVRLEGSPDAGDHWKRMRQIEFEVEREEGAIAMARFQGNALPPGLYRLECTPDGYGSRVLEEFRVNAGEVEILDLELVPLPNLTGTVRDPNGEPIAEAEVRASVVLDEDHDHDHDHGSDAGALVYTRREAETDAEGRFVLRGLPEGTVEVDVEAEGFLEHEEEFLFGEGGVRDLEVALDFGGTLSGRVVFADGKPAPGARVTVKRPDGATGMSSFRADNSSSSDTDADGRFFFSALGSGPFEVLSSTPRPGEEGYYVARVEDVEVDSDVVLTLGPGYSVRGRVVDLAGEPIKRYALSVRPEGSFSFVTDPGSVGITSQRVRDDEGRFEVDGLLPGTWTLKIVAGGYGEVESTTLILPPSPPELLVEVFRLSTIKGTVRGPDGSPVAKASVEYRIENGGFDLGSFGFKNTNRRGQFRFGGVSPGSMVISAKADGFAPAEPLTLEVGREQSRDDIVLQLGRGATIEGIVQRADGTPADGASLRWNNSERNSGAGIGVDDEGRFRVSGVPAGPVTVTATLDYTSPSGLSRGSRQVVAERVLAEGDVWTPVLREELEALLVTEVAVKRNGSPWPGVAVELVRRGEGPRWTVRADADEAGIAKLELPGPGSYRFQLEEGRTDVSGNCEVDGSGRLAFDLSLGSVSGRVVPPEGQTPLFLQVQLQPKDGDEGEFRLSGRSLDVQEDGSFSADGLLAGTYEIFAIGPVLGEDVLRSPTQELQITREGEAGPLELQLSETTTFSELEDIGGGRRRRRR